MTDFINGLKSGLLRSLRDWYLLLTGQWSTLWKEMQP